MDISSLKLSSLRFYECFNGDLTIVECPYCNLYDEDKRVCNQPVTVDCGDR